MSLSKLVKSIYGAMENEDESNEKISLHLSKVLDKMGYCRQMVQARRDIYQEYDSIHNKISSDYRLITSGSKGEGLTKPFESDIDWIYLDNDVIVTEEDLTQVAQPNMSVFTCNAHYEYPGYTMLTFRCLGPQASITLLPSLQPTNTGRLILSSESHAECALAWEKTQAGDGRQVHGRSGPASSLSLSGMEYDRVYSIPAVCPSVLEEWLDRPRQYDWPPLELRQRIAKMRGNFVAKGCKQSPMKKHEWRQCFNEAELLLVHSLEETLYKLYILLKIILKDVLRPLDHEQVLTSYVMKNIVFWLAEINPTHVFQEKNLIKCLLKALCMLKHSIESRYLPYYMIPGRNLIGPGMKTRVRANLIGRIQSLIKEGPRLLYRCEKLEYTTRMTHSTMCKFNEKRNDLEMLHLSRSNHLLRLLTNGLSSEESIYETFLAMSMRAMELTNSDWPSHIQEKLDKCEDDYGRMAVILK